MAGVDLCQSTLRFSQAQGFSINDVSDLVQALRHRVTLLTAAGLLRDAVWRLGCGS
jgi:hypothetical protein